MKRANIKDVAREAGVSITTVSHALNGYSDVSEETKKRIQEVAKRLDYIPNVAGRALGGMQKKCIAFLIIGGMGEEDSNNLIYGMISGIYSVAEQENYDFVIMTASLDRQNEVTFSQMCKEKNVTGVVIYGMRTDAPYYKQVAESDIPVVLFDDLSVMASNVRSISVDNKKAAYEIVSHMIESGYKNVAMISGSDYSDVYRRRVEGYLDALQEHGMEFLQDRVIHTEFYKKPVMKKVEWMLKEDKEIDAIFCPCDTVAMEVVSGLQKLGYRVPEDIGIAGFDGIPMAELYNGGISTVEQKPYKLLVQMLEGNETPDWTELEYMIHKRKSTEK